MERTNEEAVQLAFQNGRLVERTATDGRPVDDGDDAVRPGEGTGFDVAVKDGALEVNGSLRDAVAEHGRTLAFDSRPRAGAYAEQLSAADGELRLQAAAPNDPSDVDAYLLSAHDPSIAEPAEIDGDTWTFDVGANLYGALGEAILLEAPKPHALYYFVRRDLDLEDGDLERKLALEVERGRPISLEDDTTADNSDDPGDDRRPTWVPDCVVVATDGHDGPELERYFCEIKTGNASFERSQVATMERLARDERVLKVRMLIDGLPDRYSLRVREVEPPD